MFDYHYHFVNVGNLSYLKNEAKMTDENLYALTDKNKRTAAAIGIPLGLFAGGIGWVALLLAAPDIDITFALILIYAIGSISTGGLIGAFLATIIKWVLKIKTMSLEQLEAIKNTNSVAYSEILNYELRKLKTPYLSKDNAISFGYEFIDLEKSTSEVLILKIPDDIESADEIIENNPAMRIALGNYSNTHSPTDDALLKIVTNILSAIEHKENYLVEDLSHLLHKNTTHSQALINQLMNEKLKLQSEIKNLDDTLNDHLKENTSIIENYERNEFI